MTLIVVRMATDDAALACFAAAALLAGVAVFIIAFRMWRAGRKPKPELPAETAVYPPEWREQLNRIGDETVLLYRQIPAPDQPRHREGRRVK